MTNNYTKEDIFTLFILIIALGLISAGAIFIEKLIAFIILLIVLILVIIVIFVLVWLIANHFEQTKPLVTLIKVSVPLWPFIISYMGWFLLSQVAILALESIGIDNANNIVGGIQLNFGFLLTNFGLCIAIFLSLWKVGIYDEL